MEDDKEEHLIDSLRGAEGYSGNLFYKARRIQRNAVMNQLDDLLKIINDTRREITKIPDTLEQKELLRRYLYLAWRNYKRGDPVQSRVFILKIENNWDNVIHDIKIIADAENGRIGGLNSKKKKWAELLAAKLNEDYPYLTKEEAWRSIPDSYSPLEFETTDADYEVYQDGGKLVALNTSTRKEFEIKQSTFFKNYLKKGM